MTDTIQVNASTFEIIRREDSPNSSGSTGVCGYIGLEERTDAFEALKDLCGRDNVDKVIIVYQDHAFSLLGVSFSAVNTTPPSIRLHSKNSYRFEARDIQLEGLSRSWGISES